MTSEIYISSHYTGVKRIMAHLLFWVILFATYLIACQRFNDSYVVLLALKEVVLVTSTYYFTFYFVVPKYLWHGRYFACFLWMIVLFLYWGLYSYSALNFYFFDFMYFISFPIGIKLVKANATLRIEKTKLELENREVSRKNVQLELLFLKAQLNPHFYFNIMNTIVFLVSENPTQAEKTLAKLNRMMNYLLYESDKPLVSLESEYIFLDNYIELEKLRLCGMARIKIYLQTDRKDYYVVPLLIFPFVENAFKHGCMSNCENAWIDIHIATLHDKLCVTIANGYTHTSKNKVCIGGVGLTNVRKRLELSYPNQYSLVIDEGINSYSVKLELKLKPYTGIEAKNLMEYV